jgi:hypothetical protein
MEAGAYPGDIHVAISTEDTRFASSAGFSGDAESFNQDVLKRAVNRHTDQMIQDIEACDDFVEQGDFQAAVLRYNFLRNRDAVSEDILQRYLTPNEENNAMQLFEPDLVDDPAGQLRSMQSAGMINDKGPVKLYIRIPPHISAEGLRSNISDMPDGYVEALDHDNQDTSDGVVLNWGGWGRRSPRGTWRRGSFENPGNIIINDGDAMSNVGDKGQMRTRLGSLYLARRNWVGTEYRVNAMNGQVVSAYSKTSGGGVDEWVDNDLPDEALEMVRDAQDRLGVDYTGFDIIHTEPGGEWGVKDAHARPGIGSRTLKRLYHCVQVNMIAALEGSGEE